MSDATPAAAGSVQIAPRRLLGDGRLARLAAAGDRRAFEVIFARHHQELYRYCRAILGSSEDAEDALQGTMAAALRSLPGEKREVALRAWLFRVAHNEAISILRRRQPLADPADFPDEATEAVEVVAESRQRLRQLVADLHALPERQRSALVMRELSDLSYEEIAAALETSGAGARQVVYEARVALGELKAGREMDCEAARRAISERDGRVLRGRRLRAHLRGCEECRDFRSGIATRGADLQALFPPLPALAATGILASLLGGSGGGGGGAAGVAAGGGAAGTAAGSGGAGGAFGGALGASATVKAATVVAAVAIGAGAASGTGVVHIPLLGSGTSGSHASPVAPKAESSGGGEASGRVGGQPGNAVAARSHRLGAGAGRGVHRGAGGGAGNGASTRGHGNARGRGEGAGAAASGQPAGATASHGNGNAVGHAASANAAPASTSHASTNGLAHRSTSSSRGGSSTSHGASTSHATGRPAVPLGQTKPHAHRPPPTSTPDPTPKPRPTPPSERGKGDGSVASGD